MGGECRPLKERDLKGLIERNVHAMKGDAGRILIVGGSDRYVGAAVLAALAALRCGVDSVIIAAPEGSARLMNAFSPDLVTVKLSGPDLNDTHLEEIARLAEHASVVLIGPGLGVSEQRKTWLAKLLPRIHVPIVLDADATKQVHLVSLEQTILFANPKEYEDLKETNTFTDASIAPALGTNVLVVKSKEDTIICTGGQRIVDGGHVRATVAGTGDVVSGIAAAFYAQVKEPRVAAQASCMVAKKAAEKLGEKLGFGFLASDMVAILPETLKELRLFRVTKHEPSRLKKIFHPQE